MELLSKEQVLEKLASGTLSREYIQNVLESGILSKEEEVELAKLVEAERKEEALQDYSIFAEEYIKITDKKANQVPLIHNNIQKKINDTIIELRAAGRLVRIIVLKPRQCGVSTDTQGRMLYNTGTKMNRTGLIVAHTQAATTVIFEKARYMFSNLPDHVKPLIQASNAKELVFDRPTGYKGKGKGLHSKINIQVAGDVNIGRGDTIYYLHASEFGFWPSPDGKDPKKQLAGIMAAMPKTPDTEAIIESTANGYNSFKDLCDEAKKGKSEWVLLFFSWHDFTENVMECTNEEYQRLLNDLDNPIRDYLLGKIVNNKRIPGIIELFKLTKEQVKWWIQTLKVDNNGDLNMMKQENPSSYSEAFLATGTPVFNNDRVNMRLEYLEQKYKVNPPKRGNFTFEWGNADANDYIKDSSIKWNEDPNGFVTIYEMPMSGYPYVIGGDTKGEGRDFYSGTVINNATGNRVATIRNCWNNSKPYTWQMYCLGHFYNLALVGIEVNFNTAPIEELERLHYPRQYTRRRYDDFTKEYKTSHGWKTDGNTRPLIIDKEVHLIEENIDLFNDITMLEECITFVYNDKGRPDARSGKHDDALMADMIGNEIRQQQSFEVERNPEPVHRSFDTDTERDEGDSESPFD